MYVYDKPYTFSNGEVLDARDLNRVWKYKQDALADAASRRYIESVFPLSFVRDCGTGYDSTDSVDIRKFSFTAPADLYVTRAFLNGVFSAIGAEIKITIVKNSTSATPDGCTDPWLNVAADAPVNEEVDDYNAARFKLESGQRYDVLLSSSAAFTVTRLDVNFHVLSDRFGFDGGNEPNNLSLMVNESSRNSTQFIQEYFNKYNFSDPSNPNNQVGKLVQENYSPITYCLHGLGLTTLVQSRSKIPIPLFDQARATGGIVGYSVWVVFDTNQTNSITAQVVNSSGGILLSTVLSFSSETSKYVTGSFYPGKPLNSATSGASANTALDSFLQFKSSSPVTVDKIFVTLWVK